MQEWLADHPGGRFAFCRSDREEVKWDTALLVLSLIAAGPATGPSAEDLKAYDAAKAQTGRDPAEQVKLALWCESRGLQTERFKHLALAVLTDPTNAMARGLMGVVAYRGQWKRPETVAGGEGRRGADAETGRVQHPARQGCGDGRCSVVARSLVRAKRPSHRVPGAFHGCDPSRPLARSGLEAARLQEGERTIGHRRPARGRKRGERAPEESRQAQEAAPDEISRHAR